MEQQSNFITLKLNGKMIGLKFSGWAMEYLEEISKTAPVHQTHIAEGRQYQTWTLIGQAHILYAGYANNCYASGREPKIKYRQFYNLMEDSLLDPELAGNVSACIDCFNNTGLTWLKKMKAIIDLN